MRRYVASKFDQCSRSWMTQRKAREQELKEFKFVFRAPGKCVSVLANSGPSRSLNVESL